VIHPVTVTVIWNGIFVAAILLLTATIPAVAQQPAPPPQPGTPPPAQPQQPPAPGQPQPPTGQEPTIEAPPPTPAERGSVGGVVPEDPLQAEQPTITAPQTFIGPDLFPTRLHQGWITIAPSLTLSGEYNDNIFQSANGRTSDFIFSFIPGVTLSVQRPEYGLLAGYNVKSDIFVNESEQSGFGNQHQLFADGFYRLDQRTRLTLRERLIIGEDTSDVSPDSSSAGRQDSLRNTFVLGVQHDLTERWSLRAQFAQTHLQFSGEDDARDSDTFRLLVGADYQFSPRLRGIAQFESGYAIVEGEPDAFVQRPRLGFDYQFTPTLSGGLLAGPEFFTSENETEIQPSVTAQVAKLFSFGSLRGGYDYRVTAGTFGISDRHSIFATFTVNNLVRNLVFQVTPRFTFSDFKDRTNEAVDDSRQTEVMTLTIRATYQLTQALSIIASYTFYHQNEDRSNSVNETTDQNRVFLGVQYAFPIVIY
jgi:predicted porin